ncbi:MAG: phosphoribosyltransferase [Saezia sp.]
MAPYSAIIHPASYRSQPYDNDHLFEKTYSVQIGEQGWLEIPLCALPGGQEAIALLMSNQSSFQVIEHLTTLMAQKANLLQPDCIAAVPTMGLEYASRIAQKLGHEHYVAMGFSHKFWYDENLSESVVSTTSPDQTKKLYIDPALLDRVQGKRIVVIDDVINTGVSVSAAIRLLKKAGAHVVGTVVALTEGYAWKKALASPSIGESHQVLSIGHIPIFSKQENSWVARPNTL